MYVKNIGSLVSAVLELIFFFSVPAFFLSWEIKFTLSTTVSCGGNYNDNGHDDDPNFVGVLDKNKGLSFTI